MSETRFRLHPKQAEAFWSPANEILYGGAAGGGKAVPLNTEVPTPQGFVRIGDIRKGDEVFDMYGHSCHVTEVFDVIESPELWEFTLDDGTKVVSCKDHQWVTYTAKDLERLTKSDSDWMRRRREKRPKRGKGLRPDLAKRNSESTRPGRLPTPTTKTTKEIVETLTVRYGRANHAIPVTNAVEYPARELPIHPYVLGVWLGDGTTTSGDITCFDLEILEKVRSYGYTVEPTKTKGRYRVVGFRQSLRELGLLGGKRVPELYLYSSVEQRIDMVRGLFDTDGTVTEDGSSEFCNTNKQIVDSVVQVLCSLGVKANAREGIAKLNGRDCGPKWTIKVTPYFCAFYLPRKAERAKVPSRRVTKFRYIKSARLVPSKPARCISVGSPSKTFLITRNYIPTHNSYLARVSSILYSMAIPGLNTYFFRRQYSDLVTNHLEGPSGFRALLHHGIKDKSVRILSDERILFVKNNSIIFLCHCQHEKDLDAKYRGPEMHYLIIEEATQFTEKMIRFLRTRNRMVGVQVPSAFKGMFPRILYTTNPGGPSHSYFYRNFVLTCDGEVTQQPDEEGGMRRLFIRSKLEDNPSMAQDDPDYEKRLSGLGPPQLVRALRDGDWTAVEGAFFPELNESHKLDDFPIPAHWARFRAFDWGNKSPFAVQWWAVSPGELVPQVGYDGRIFPKYIPRGAIILYREWYGRDHRSRVIELDNDRIASGITERSGGEQYLYSVADASIFSKYGGPSIAEQFARAGVVFKESSKNRKGGLSEIRRRLVGADGSPMLYAFKSCQWWWETVPSIQVDDNDPEDCDTDGEDHHVDATYYACMSRPWVPDPYTPAEDTASVQDMNIRQYLNYAKRKNTNA